MHNGIITNYKDVKKFLEKRGYEFESETDTEIIAKLIHHLYMQHPNDSFRELVEQAILQLVRHLVSILASASDILLPFRKELLHWPSSRNISQANVSQHVAAHRCSLELKRKRVSRPITFQSYTAKVSQQRFFSL